MRLVAVVTEDTTSDMTWNLVDQGIWAKMEADFAIISGTSSNCPGTHSPPSIQMLIIAACLPTLRPLYVAIRPKRFGTVASAPSAYPPASEGVTKKRTLQSWGMTALQSRDEDTMPFSHAARSAEVSSQPGSIKEPQGAAVTAVPLSSVRTHKAQGSDAIMVETAWDVEYTRNARPGGDAVMPRSGL